MIVFIFTLIKFVFEYLCCKEFFFFSFCFSYYYTSRSSSIFPQSDSILNNKIVYSIKNQSESINNFGNDLLKEFLKGKGNVFFSPLSIYQALMMVGNGALGQTKNEFNKVLRLEDFAENETV